MNIGTWNKHSVYKGSNFNWYRHSYGGLKNNMEKLGLEYLYYNEITKDELSERTLALFEKHGRIGKELCGRNGISSHTVVRHFGGYNEMFQALGLPINMHKNVSKEELMEDIESFILTHDTVSTTMYRKYGKYSQSTIDKYGGWVSVIGELGFESQKVSGPERLIQNRLSELGIGFFIHHSFPWLKTENDTNMYVDFFIPSKNLVIEYDGRQHYYFTPYFHKTKEGFERSKRRDILKEKLLKDNGIALKRIIYSDNILSELDKLMD